MADEPNKRMDEALKAYARKRREEAGTPAEMHPATRRMLQGEVARLYGRPKPASALSAVWLRLLPRVGFALSLAVLLALILWTTQPPAPQLQMAGELKDSSSGDLLYRQAEVEDLERIDSVAQKPARAVYDADNTEMLRNRRKVELNDFEEKPPQPTEPAPAGAAAATPAGPPAGKVGDEFRDARPADKTVREVDGLYLAYEPVAAGLATNTARVSRNERLDESKFGRTLQAGATNTPSAYGVLTAGVGLTPGLQSIPTNAPLTEAFIALAKADHQHKLAEEAADQPAKQVAQELDVAAATDALVDNRAIYFWAANEAGRGGAQLADLKRQVLTNFQLRHSGNEVQVVDSDGSVYRGPIIGPTESESRSEALQQRLRLGAVDESGQQTQRAKVAFRATGTNRTLNQLVVLDGAIEPGATPASKAASVSPRPDEVASRHRVQSTSAPVTNESLRFRGQLRIGQGQEINVEAYRVDPHKRN